jgi:hypothetical protein
MTKRSNGSNTSSGSPRFPRYLYNRISIAGMLLVALAGIPFLALLLLELTQGGMENPYTGILLYMVFPPIILVGLVLIPWGGIRRWKRRNQDTEEFVWPALDLNRAHHRNAFVVFVVGTVALLAFGVVGLTQAYHHTESVTFCGETCHGVMEPEHTAYQRSAHARVRCTACHVGPGAGWYARSKLSGLYQVYATTFDKYPRPIDTPIRNLRPAQETCEECHWPEKFFGGQQKRFNHFRYDSASTPWPIDMILKTGGGDPRTGQPSGIHWHMNIKIQVEYIARDKERMDIPWVRITDRETGRVTVYEDEDDPMPADSVAAAVPRTMDCMDCHNRPAHVFHSPDHLADTALLTGKVARSLPEAKRACVEALAGEYETKAEASAGIASAIAGFYEENYPDVFRASRAAIDEAILATQDLYASSLFPEMKVRWSAYPDNIGHFQYPGCMRCHDGSHRSEGGEAITADCATCHTILLQGSGADEETASVSTGLEFRHPEDIGDAWRENGCYECHQGVQP